MKFIICLQLIPFLFICFLNAQTDSADLLLNNYYKKICQEKLNKINSIKTIGKITIRGKENQFVTYQKRPDKYRTVIQFGEFPYVQGFDGTNAWGVFPWTGKNEPIDLSDNQLGLISQISDFDAFFNLKKHKAAEFEYLGKETVDSTDYLKIKIIYSNCLEKYLFFTKKDNLFFKEEFESEIQNKEKFEIIFSNYQECEGILFPMLIEAKAKKRIFNKVIIEDIIMNQEINDSIFMKPIIQ